MKYASLFIILAMIVSCSPKPKDCNKFKIGNYEYENPEFSNWIVTRNDSIQTELDKKTNHKLIGDVEWLSDCQYLLTYTEISDPSLSHLLGVKVTVDITTTFRDSYEYHAYDKNQENKGKMIKL